MKKYLDVAGELQGFDEAKKLLNDGEHTVSIRGCVSSQKVHMSESMREGFPLNLFITEDEKKLACAAGDCAFFGVEAYAYPAKDMMFYNADISGNQVTADRLKCIKKIIDVVSGRKGMEPITVITTPEALTESLIPLEKYKTHTLFIRKGEEIPKTEFAAMLVKTGYERCDRVTAPGEFCERGGIIDVFPITEDVPYRIEFWGDETDTVRTFDPDSQRSLEDVESVEIFPATEVIFTDEEIEKGSKKLKKEFEKRLKELGDDNKKKTKEEYEACNRLKKAEFDFDKTGDYSKYILFFEEEPVTFLDYFPSDKTIITADELSQLKLRADSVKREYDESTKYRFENGYILKKQTGLILDFKKTIKELKKRRLLTLYTFEESSLLAKPDISLSVSASGIHAYNNSFEELVKDLKKYKKDKFRVVIATNSSARRDRLKESLRDYDIDVFSGDDNDKKIGEGEIAAVCGSISRGFTYPLFRFALITENDIYTAGRLKKHKKKSKKTSVADFDLKPGDYVVHESYGIGIYRGIEKKTVDDSEKDYIKIDYAGNSCLFVLATQTDVLQKYASSETDKKPVLNKLGSPVWNNTKSRARASAELVAQDLVKLYATRSSIKGFRFSEDTPWQREFEEMFPYEETQDQLDAIADVKRDMESDRIMDRLICGDVGFGKTEVALRAAFKAVQDGKQVIFLTPTTILAGQHYDTFAARMKPFPVSVSLMSGMKSSAENKKTAALLSKGLTDIVIGTHRLLSKDISFKDLGLLIIDEEQRFGVNQKEKIKKIKAQVDVLALSATPIPRTLNMSLAGIRDMSTLEEAPVDRMPIQTFVSEYDDTVVREAINREINRGGQVYYVCNRIARIEDVRARLEALIPDAVFEHIHGRLDKKTLEAIMTRFINGETDVLISTTIIETGLDIPNVNTIIVEKADNFGLSQLYQLRGRVGRASRRAYAFLLYNREKIITEVAQKRLIAIRELTDLGSGYKLAMKDLEIRGAGSLLGKTQHGHMASVGFEMYTEMLNAAVAKQKGIEVPEVFETVIDINIDAYLPDSYVQRETQKLELYKKIACISSIEDMKETEEELKDRFGNPPKAAVNLMQLALIKSMAHALGITDVRGGKNREAWIIRMEFKEGFLSESVEKKYEEFAGENKDEIVFSRSEKPILLWHTKTQKLKNEDEFLKGLTGLLGGLKDKLKIK